MTRKLLVPIAVTTAVLVALGSDLGAQGPVRAENPAKIQASRFETVLRNAIEDAGRQLAQQAREVAPELTLQVTDPAIARGVRLGSYGFFFDVQAPDIRSTLIALQDMMSFYDRQRGPMQPVRAGSDPVLPAPSGSAVVFNPDEVYTSFVRESVIDALLENSGMLALSPGEVVTVSVSGIDQPNPNPLYRTNSVRLILTIRAADLLDFRQGRLSKEQAKERIAQERF